jgi:hypothetical protein
MRDVAVALHGAETVYFASGNAWDAFSRPKTQTRALRRLEEPLFGLVDVLGGADFRLNQPDTVEHVLVSARNFHQPPNLGPVMADTLYVIRLRHAETVRFAAKYRRATRTRLGGEEWQWGVVLERGAQPTQVTATKIGSILLVATSPELLAEAISSTTRGTDRTEARGLLANFDRASGLWAVRVYRAKLYVDRMSAGLSVDGQDVGPHAKWSLFELRSRGELSVRYCSTGDAEGPLGVFESLHVQVNEIHAGLWEAKLRLGDDENDEVAVLEVLGIFGFGIYV